MEQNFYKTLELIHKMESCVRSDPQMVITYNLISDIQLELNAIQMLLKNKSSMLQYNVIPRINKACEELTIIQDWLIVRVAADKKHE